MPLPACLPSAPPYVLEGERTLHLVGLKGQMMTGAVGPAGQADWTTYHRDGLRSGYAPGTPALGTLRAAWTARLDGAVYGQPLVVRGKVVAATENDTVYALAPDTGRVLWHRHLGTPQPRSGLGCGNIDPLGITGTPVYDPSTGLVFAVAETAGEIGRASCRER